MESNILAKLRKARGFTLIELLIVIAIIAILSVAFLPTLRGGQSKARDAAKIALVQDIVTSLENDINAGNSPALPTNVIGGVAPAGSVGNVAVGGGQCIYNYTQTDANMIALSLGRAPQSFQGVGSGAGHLCNDALTPTMSGIFYKNFAVDSFMLAVELENKDSANVKQGETAAIVQGYANKTAVITGTSGAPGTGDAGKYYYAIAR